MMNRLYFLLVLAIAGCNNRVQQTDTVVKQDTVAVEKLSDTTATSMKVYSNERFKDVTVEKTGEHTFLVKGKGQIFEASFSWVVEDGHNELLKGFEMTDAGAPEWGNFSFTIEAKKERENSTLHLILFESSPKDGSRQYELPVLLY
jgi:hypothetical protein